MVPFMAPPQTHSDPLLSSLSALADQADGQAIWPAASWEILERLGGLRWCVPLPYGGQGHNAIELLRRYEGLARTCLTTCFILSQRDAACRRIREHGTEAICQELLPPLADGSRFATVGLSHLTTSRQHVQPVLVANEEREYFVLNGFMPWVTGASHADFIVTGATLEDGRQILAVLPRALDGVDVGPPLELMALAGSITAEVRCRNVKLERRWLLAGPIERVLAQGRGGPGGLETSCLALGLAMAAIENLHHEAAARPQLKQNVQRLQHAADALRADIYRFVEQGGSTEQPMTLRARANALVLRATQTALTASKGTGFVRPHPAQRWARQALFFLVWSCPAPAAEATLAYLSPADGPECPI
jgi:alkylation response protein AidB-like acyl-CoA dehydrogenase